MSKERLIPGFCLLACAGDLRCQDVLSEPQNWTLIGVVGTVFVAVIGLLVWIVKWLCTRFASSIDKVGETVVKLGDVVGEGTQINLKVAAKLDALNSTVDNLGDKVGELPCRPLEDPRRHDRRR